jgi:hypothetical protein
MPRLCHWSFIIVIAMGLSGCMDSGGATMEELSVTVRNQTNQTLGIHYQGKGYDVGLDEVAVDKTDTLSPGEEKTFVIYYDAIPEIQVTGPGFDRTYNAWGFTGGRIVINQNQLNVRNG